VAIGDDEVILIVFVAADGDLDAILQDGVGEFFEVGAEIEADVEALLGDDAGAGSQNRSVLDTASSLRRAMLLFLWLLRFSLPGGR